MRDDDPVALRSERYVNWFTRYVRWSVGRNFHAARVAKGGMPTVDPDGPLIIYTNHPSWWDPAFCFLLGAHFLPGRPGYGPIDAQALRQYGIFRRLGLFGIEPDRRGAARFSALAARVLSQPGNVLWITAEGHFADVRPRPIRLRPGLAHLARRVPGVTILPLALEYTFWNESRPEALARFGDPIAGDGLPAASAWTDRLEQELAAVMDALAADSITRDTGRFTAILSGSAGIGGPYDAWRRLKAAAAGRRFDASHEGAKP